MKARGRGATRIGLTMRVVEASGYVEPRDALVQDWPRFLDSVTPEVAWALLPNLGPDIIKYAQTWGLDGFILTGGDNIGDTPTRDATEHALLHFSRENSFPVLGVCRGMQVIYTDYGGNLEPCPQSVHVAQRHPVALVGGVDISGRFSGTVEVNSFHNYGVKAEGLPGNLVPLAYAEGGWIEAFRVKESPILGIMWHPERERPIRELDRRLVRNLFGLPTLRDKRSYETI